MADTDTLQIEFKVFAQGEPPDAQSFVPLFHRVIREQGLPGMLIDVADYRHVFHGPAVLLVGHDGDYCWDLRDGRAGMLYRRKRDASGDRASQITEALRRVLLAAQTAASEPAVDARFDLATIEFRVLDRLRAPAEPAQLEHWRDALSAALGPSLGGLSAAPFGEPGAPLGLRIAVRTPPAIDDVLAALNG